MRYHLPERYITSRERLALAVVLSSLALFATAMNAGCAIPDSNCEEVQTIGVKTDLVVFASETAAYVMRQDLKILEQMQADYPGLKMPDVFWIPCGEENGSYNTLRNTITICAEDLEHPAWSIQVAAHEMGHAITGQFASIYDENAADEIAILAMVRHGWLDEMLASAVYMRENWLAFHIPGDPHPSGAYRAWELICAEEGAEGLLDPSRPASPECDALYRGLVVKWDMRIPRRYVPILNPAIHPTP